MWQLQEIPGVVKVVEGGDTWAPVVLDVPHSGARYPQDLDASMPVDRLRHGEDCLADALFDPAGTGAVLIAAEFARVYIDPNRPTDDLNPDMLREPWPQPLRRTPENLRGKGLIWGRMLDFEPIYRRQLSAAEVHSRIEHYWRPYRQRLAEALDQAHARAGRAWHINCHSMHGVWPAGVRGAGTPVEADVLLGDRDGTTCAPWFTEMVCEFLRQQGFEVAVNDRFKGVDIVARSGDPANERHSLQIEVVQDRYMDESSGKPHAGYARVRESLAGLIGMLCEEARTS